jgi:plasmid stabilization system protein ParE
MRRVTFHELANKDFEESYDWYEKKEENLGERFAQAIRDTLKIIQDRPEMFHIIKQSFREASVSVFPYTIVYRFNKKKDAIFIVSIYHGKRNLKKKFRR